MILLHGLLLAGAVYYFFKRSRVEDKFLFWSAWVFRVVMGVALGLVYMYYYNANDTWHFFEDAKTLSALARTNWIDYLNFLFTGNAHDSIWQALFYTQERSLFLVKFISVLAWLSADSYWTCALYFSTISFLAAWTLFSVIIRFFENAKPAAALAFLFFPSVVFWSSGLVKETLALAGIFWLSSVILRHIKSESITIGQVVISFIALWIAWNLKYYWAALFVAVSVTTLIIHWLQKVEMIKTNRLWAWSLLFVILFAVASQVHPNFYFSRFLDVVVTNHNAFVKISKPEGLIHFYNLQPEWWSMVINSPLALVSGLFRPWLGEANGFTGYLAATENLFLVILLGGLFFRKSWKVNNPVLLLAILVYVLILCVLMALSTPNFGTLSRYRIGFLPFFVFVIAYGNPLINFLKKRLHF
ncbi:MAG TPA: hypothetical protein PLM56_00210 [Cyclobacteriaceae bacterium]|nr:hypothetical protein [Cyclobacteriaceae bacterium]HRF31889.1 hypothetical protein [Cyclobacteriaceae bacterium]